MSNLSHSFRGMKKLVHDGQVMILFAVASLVLIGAVALAVDVGFLLAERRQVQAAADSAALAAAQSGLDKKTAQIISAGKDYGMVNAGVAAGGVDVDPNAPAPPGGDGEQYIEVTITKDVQKFFLGAIYKGKWTVTASALAAVEPVGEDYALITLNKDADPGIYMNGNTGVIVTGGGGAASNSNIEGGKNTDFIVGGAIHAYGDITNSDNWVAPKGIEGNRGRHVEDPLKDVAPPPKGSEPKDLPKDCKKDCNLKPGRYRNWNFTIDGEATLSPGVYYFENSNLNLQNTKSTIQGTGVHLYFDANSSFDPKNGNVYISAIDPAEPDVDPNYRDIAFWAASCDEINPQGNTVMRITGIYYAPCAHVRMNGTPGVDTVDGQVIVGSLELKGTADLTLHYEARVESAIPTVFLVN